MAFLYKFCNKHVSRSIVLLSSCAVVSSYQYRSRCDEIVKEALSNSNANDIANNTKNTTTATKTTTTTTTTNEDDDAAWEAEKQSCSFCRQFLQSPCKDPFKKWSKCVDKAKVDNTDFVTECSQYTSALMTCTSDNAEYFNMLFSQQKIDDGDDINEEDENKTEIKNINTNNINIETKQ
jgi:hypothetical protein